MARRAICVVTKKGSYDLSVTIDTNEMRGPARVTETVQTAGFTIPSVLQEALKLNGPIVGLPRLVRVKRRADNVMAQVVALAPKDGGGVVLNFEDGQTVFGFQYRPGMTITAHGVTPQRLRQLLLVACDALAKAEETINDGAVQA